MVIGSASEEALRGEDGGEGQTVVDGSLWNKLLELYSHGHLLGAGTETSFVIKGYE